MCATAQTTRCQQHLNGAMSGNVIVYSLFALIVGITLLAVREVWRATRSEKKSRSAHSGGSAAEIAVASDA